MYKTKKATDRRRIRRENQELKTFTSKSQEAHPKEKMQREHLSKNTPGRFLKSWKEESEDEYGFCGD